MIAVLIPAHNEEDLIQACLDSVQIAAAAPGLHGEKVSIVVALDRCTDSTAAIAQSVGVQTVALPAGNVGQARAAAAEHALAQGARWLATTDADSRVPRDWLAAQLAYDCDAFCGLVGVDDWLDFPLSVQRAYTRTQMLADGHPHVHGANMGISAAMYRRSGGFQSLKVSEDVALVSALVRLGATIARKPSPVVMTSPRRASRATGGFADYLKELERSVFGATPSSVGAKA
jgi:glycosyltransferase involved in cell wall biosynthesis